MSFCGFIHRSYSCALSGEPKKSGTQHLIVTVNKLLLDMKMSIVRRYTHAPRHRTLFCASISFTSVSFLLAYCSLDCSNNSKPVLFFHLDCSTGPSRTL
jgi:hypothetical protein